MKSILDWILGKEAPKPFEIEFYNLSEWIGKHIEKEVGYEVAEHAVLLKRLEEKSKALDKLSVDEQNVEKKLKDLVKGNKPAYVNGLRILTQKIKTPKTLAYNDIEDFCKRTEEGLNEFNKKTVRNYSILKMIIGKELAEIIELLKQIEALETKLKSKFLISSKLKTSEDLIKRLKELYSYELAAETRKGELNKLQNKEVEIAAALEIVNKKLAELRASHTFREYEQLNIRISELAGEELRLKGTLSAMFSELARPLRKMDKESRLANNYIENAYDSLMKDSKLEIINLLDELKKKIETGKIEVKNKKKLADDIHLDMAELKKYREKANSIAFESGLVFEKLKANRLEAEEKNLTENFQRLENELSETVAQIDTYKDKGRNINMEYLANDIEKLVGRKVTIRNAPIM